MGFGCQAQKLKLGLRLGVVIRPRVTVRVRAREESCTFEVSLSLAALQLLSNEWIRVSIDGKLRVGAMVGIEVNVAVKFGSCWGSRPRTGYHEPQCPG